ncbi:RNA polymerase sigma factor, partial [Cellulomonas septica]|nr:RNA polymerase sigma factor [Cellulomonas septica]
ELLARAGRPAAAAAAYRHALTLVTSPTERRHLESRLAEVTSP